MTVLLILTGGQGTEHEVSLASAKSLMDALKDDSQWTVIMAVITKDGKLLDHEDSIATINGGNTRGLTSNKGAAKVLHMCDVVFPLIHGYFGEDGRLQYILDTLKVRYIGSGYRASSICINKKTTKDILSDAHIPQTRYIAFSRADTVNINKCINTVVATLDAPWFVKPAESGSSIGITKVTNFETLCDAIGTAQLHCDEVVIEEAVCNVRELEVGIIGNISPLASVIGEIVYSTDFYSYDAKYTPGLSKHIIPAKIQCSVQNRVLELAFKTYALLGCDGMARVDFLYSCSNGEVYVNEVNTVPGFTSMSMFPLLWKATGIGITDLLEQLINFSKNRHQ